MKFRIFFSAAAAFCITFSTFAQTHVEGEEYYKADQFSNAKELLERSLNNSATDKAISNYYLGLIAMREGKLDEASNYFNAGLSANPNYGFNSVGLGAIALKKGDKSLAEKYFKEASKVQGKSASLQIAIARAYYDADPVAYEKQIADAIKKANKESEKRKEGGIEVATNPDIYLFQGDMERDKGGSNAGPAANQYEMGANYNPNETAAYVKYAELFTEVNPQFAIDKLNELLALNPNSALAQREIANAYYNNKQYKEAAEAYGNYVKNPSHFKQDEDRYSFLLFYSQDYQKGYDYASQLLASDSNNFTAQRYQFMNAANIKEMENNLLPLATALWNAHKANPKNKMAPIDYNLIGYEFQNAKQPELAQAVIEEAIAEYPTNANFYKMLANIYVDENNLTKATEAFENYVNNLEKPGYNDLVQLSTFAFYAGVENSQNNPDAANKYYDIATNNANKAKDMSADYPKPFKILGDIAKQKATGDAVKSAAVPYYTQAIEVIEGLDDPSRYKSDAKEIYMYLGNYFVEQNNIPTAKTYFNKYLELDPDNATVKDYVNKLK